MDGKQKKSDDEARVKRLLFLNLLGFGQKIAFLKKSLLVVSHLANAKAVPPPQQN